MSLELNNWQQVQDYLQKTSKLSLTITEKNIKNKDEKAKTIVIQTTRHNSIKTLYRKSLKSGQELQDAEVKPYVINLIKTYVGSID